MLGELNKKEITQLLEEQGIGRIGCHVKGETYIVPVNYVYKDGFIYAHSGAGKKIEMMRENPNICFQVDQIADTFQWRSVILWGTYEELSGEQRQQVMQALIHRIMPLTTKPTQEPSHAISAEFQDNLIVYRIKVNYGSGRFESHIE